MHACLLLLPDSTRSAECSYMERDYQKVSFWVRKADLPEESALSFSCGNNLRQIGDATASEQVRQWILVNAPGFLHDIPEELEMQINAAGPGAFPRRTKARRLALPESYYGCLEHLRGRMREPLRLPRVPD